jgi:hypothetical protein
MKKLLLLLCLFVASHGIAAAAEQGSEPASKKNADGKARTLDAIQIEGEVDMPQVLFITARERYRTMDHLHRNYVKNCSQIGKEAQIPKRLSRSQDKTDGNLSKEN